MSEDTLRLLKRAREKIAAMHEFGCDAYSDYGDGWNGAKEDALEIIDAILSGSLMALGGKIGTKPDTQSE